MHRRSRSLRELQLEHSGQSRILGDLLRNQCFNARAAKAKLHTWELPGKPLSPQQDWCLDQKPLENCMLERARCTTSILKERLFWLSLCYRGVVRDCVKGKRWVASNCQCCLFWKFKPHFIWTRPQHKQKQIHSNSFDLNSIHLMFRTDISSESKFNAIQ